LTAIGCFAAAIALELGICWLRDRSGSLLGFDAGIVFGSLCMILVLAILLPWSYSRQAGFNRSVQWAKEARALNERPD
jgi:hypothetical protein